MKKMPTPMDSFDYRYILINGEAQSTTDEEGNTVEPTAEEEEAAMAAAQQQAQNFKTAVMAADDREAAFIELAPDYVSETNHDAYAEDPDRSLSQGVLGSVLSPSYGEWLQDASRQAGDIEVLEASGGTGYYVVLFLDRYRDETPTVNVRHILIQAQVPEDDPGHRGGRERRGPHPGGSGRRQGRGRVPAGPVGVRGQDRRVLRRAGQRVLRRSRLQHHRRPV